MVTERGWTHDKSRARTRRAKLGAGARLLLQQPLRLPQQRVPVHPLGAAAEVGAEAGGVQRIEQRQSRQSRALTRCTVVRIRCSRTT